MSKRHTAPPVDFADFMAKAEVEHSWPITLGGEAFRVKSPKLLSAANRKLMESADNEDDVARFMIDDYDGFVAAGGNATMLGLFIESMLVGDDDGESPGE